MARRADFGLDADATLNPAKVHTDEFGQTHTHLQQFYRGVKVWGGQAITHMDRNGAQLPVTSALKAGIALNTVPSLQSDEVLALAHQDLAPKGAYASQPTAELVIFPVMAQTHVRAGNDATAYEQQVVRYALAYHVHTDLQNGTGETKQVDYMMDAHTGAFLKKWNRLETSAAVGTGHSQYSGTVNINTNSTSGGFELRDTTRATGSWTFGVGNVVTNMNNGTSGNGTVYTNTTDTWGDGANYSGGSTTSANGQTAAVDAAYGIQATWDMYKNVFGRNGIDGAGKSSYLRVHYSSAYDNAFWDDTCFCMTFGDGSQFKSLESVDVAGHEMSHGVTANSVPGGLTYSGESGGLNESNSDSMGTMVEFYDLGGGEASASTTVPSTGGNWTIGEQLETPSFPTPLRYMYKPSLDGSSPDAWSSSIGGLDVHYSSGPGNRQFYFLSQGASSSSSSDFYSSYTPGGFAGVGNDHAARIHYRALTTYYNSNETYAQDRTDHLSAAADLYGTGSAEYAAVQNSFAAINVGSPATGVSVSISPTSASLNTNATQQFSDTVTGSSNTAVTWSVVESGGGSVSSAGLYTAPATAGTYHVKVTSQADTTKSAQATVTVTAPASVSVTISPTSSSLNTNGTQQFSDTVTGTSNTAVTWSVVESGGGSVSSTGLYTAPATAGTFHVKVTSQADTTKSAQATVTVTVPTSVAISISPTSSSLSTGGTQQFTDTVTGTSNTAVTWSVVESGGGSVSSTGLYTAPATAGTFHVKVTSQADATKSAQATVTVTGGTGGTEQIKNGGFESGTANWTTTAAVIGQNGPSEPAHAGTWDAWLDGYGSTHTDYVYQQVTVPASGATLSFYLHIDTAETTTTTAYDKFTILVQNTSGTTLATLGTFSNLNAAPGYTLHSYSLAAYAGKTIRLKFNGTEDVSLQTSFVLDDVSVK